MMTLSFGRFAVAIGGVAVALTASMTAATGVASADPLDPVINTTCNYGQVMAALRAQDPAAADQFNQSPAVQSYLNQFLAAPPAKRRQMAQQIQAMPQAAPYLNDIIAVSGTCNNY